jgi:hypothetical protein
MNDLPPDVSHPSAGSAPSGSKPRLGQLMLLIAAVAIGIVGIRNCDSQMQAIQIDRLGVFWILAFAADRFAWLLWL